jgi:hypothetical protein
MGDIFLVVGLSISVLSDWSIQKTDAQGFGLVF